MKTYINMRTFLVFNGINSDGAAMFTPVKHRELSNASGIISIAPAMADVLTSIFTPQKMMSFDEVNKIKVWEDFSGAEQIAAKEEPVMLRQQRQNALEAFRAHFGPAADNIPAIGDKPGFEAV